MSKHILIGAILWLAGAGSIAAQTTVQQRARAVLPPPVFQGVQSLASAAGKEGIPSDPLFSKALEGMAKRVPPDRLLTAVRGYADRLRQAHAAFGAGSPAPLLVAGADALQRGVGWDALHKLGESGSHSPMAVLVLADLMETGVPADRALAVLHEAMRMRMRDNMMLDIPERVRRFMREGTSPADAAERVRWGMEHGMWRAGGGVGPAVPPGSEPMGRRRKRPGGGGAEDAERSQNPTPSPSPSVFEPLTPT